MPSIILHQPQIPPNTGNIIRLAANCGFDLHLITPLGFVLDQKSVRRSGMDYREMANIRIHDSLENCVQQLDGARLVLVSTRGAVRYDGFTFDNDDALLFGNEGSGLPDSVWDTYTSNPCITIPMRPGNRSINLANAVAIVAWQCWQQLGFYGAVCQSGT